MSEDRDDIVKRLRERSSWLPGIGYHETYKVTQEATAEIDRLRAEIDGWCDKLADAQVEEAVLCEENGRLRAEVERLKGEQLAEDSAADEVDRLRSEVAELRAFVEEVATEEYPSWKVRHKAVRIIAKRNKTAAR